MIVSCVIKALLRLHFSSGSCKGISNINMFPIPNPEYHSLCNTSCGALEGTRNNSMGQPRRIDPMTYHAMSRHLYKITMTSNYIGAGCSSEVVC